MANNDNFEEVEETFKAVAEGKIYSWDPRVPDSILLMGRTLQRFMHERDKDIQHQLGMTRHYAQQSVEMMRLALVLLFISTLSLIVLLVVALMG
jgi:hypothetical protein